MSQIDEDTMVGKTESRTVKDRPPMIDIISSETYSSLKKEAEQKSTSLRKHTNNILDSHFDNQELLKKLLPDLEVIAFKDGLLIIMDSRRNTIAKIGFGNNGFLHCDLCKKSDCVHVMLALPQPEISKLESFPKKR